MLSTWLDDTQTWAESESLSHFQRAIPLEWISQGLETTQIEDQCRDGNEADTG